MNKNCGCGGNSQSHADKHCPPLPVCEQPKLMGIFQSISINNPLTFCFSQKSNEAQEIREMDKNGMGSDRCAFGSRTFENFNEPVECKLLTAEINEMDFLKKFDRFGNFNQVTEKMAIDLLLRLTQVQHINATPTGGFVDDCISQEGIL